MPHISYQNREIAFKLVYYGPGMSGKTTNLIQIHKSLPKDLRGEMLNLDTEEERTLFFDFFPLELGNVEGYAVRFNMYTVPGQVYYEASRRLILQGADGVVFVADSQPQRFDENLESFHSMSENLRDFGIDFERYPLALQYNKRDCVDPIPIGSLEKELGLNGVPVVEAVANQGKGVMETIRNLSRDVVQRFQL
ncbi:MAG: gliding-motility protein MglA [Deltaproteobacteria bacterium CG2_30_63_29]|nr:MAG: gliding-motility protein MglA [Deltaproteobacteria bacterium CG2_30_63_29]